MSNKLQTVSQAYYKEVIPTFLPGLTTDTLYSAQSGLIGEHLFNISLNSNAFLDTLPEKYKPNSSSVVQFTSLKVLFSILNERGIRLYNLNNMNDPDEMNYLFKHLDSNEDLINYYKNNVYVSSFCSEEIFSSDNILNLWRLYGDGGNGVAIEFEISEDVKHKRDYLFAKTVYEKINISKIIEANKIFEKKYDVEVNYNELFKIPACMHKNPAYSIEQEVRLIFFSKEKQMREMAEKNLRYKPDVNRFGQVITYFKMPINAKEDDVFPSLKIKKIQFGFKTSEKVFNSVKDKLDSFFRGFVYSGIIEEDDFPVFEMSPLENIYR